MDRKSSSDHGNDQKRASQLGCWGRSEARREATHPTTSLSCRDNAGRSSIAMRIASEYFDREHDRVLPIATTIANEQVSCDESCMTTFIDREGDRERVRRSRTRLSTFYRDNAHNRASLLQWGSHDDTLLIAMMIANEYLDCKESRKWAGSVATMVAMNHASSSATRVAMNFGMFDRDEDRNEQDNIFKCEKQTKCNKRSKETCTFGLLGLIRFARAYQSLAKEVKKRNQQSTRLWLLSCSSSVKWSAWIPALTTNKKGSSSLNKLDNKPDWFLTTQDASLVYTTTLWTESCLATLGTCWLQNRANHTPAMDVARINCCCCCGSSWAPFVFVQMIFAIDFHLQCLIAFKHWQNKIK